MSSMRNAVQRRNHRERAQPLEREKWGILEKHKDYSLRAKDHNEKKRRLKVLKQKAAERNPDEFAFGMMSATTKSGVKVTQRQAENGRTGPLDMDVVKLLKTQDAGYLQTVLQQTRKERERVQKDVIMITTGVDAKSSNKKTFDDTEGLVAEENDDDDDIPDLSALPDLMDMSEDESVSSDGAQDTAGLTKEQIRLRRRKRHAREILENKLEALQDREKRLSTALNTIQDQRAKMNHTVGGVNKSGVKFKVRERKR